MAWYQVGGIALAVGLAIYMIGRAADFALAWWLDRHFRREVEELNKTAPLIPQQRESEENNPDAAN